MAQTTEHACSIKDHVPGKLSALEAQMAKHIPPGGNWESIPFDIKSDRLAQIRRMSEARGRCRTTYYGRLDPNKPSYTINTYFSRLGNGAFLHYDIGQNRLISLREAARLQSFPDSFVFGGSFTSKFQQIGNSVPPFLAYCLVREKYTGLSVLDLFCGAGGLSLGLQWAHNRIIGGVDKDKNFIQTYRLNHPAGAILGDLTDSECKNDLIGSFHDADMIVGGPPCQGFSQAGWFDPKDSRNLLFREFLELVERISPKYFIMENVQGILWSDKGKAIKVILQSFRDVGYTTNCFVLSSDHYGIPQVRKRVFITGSADCSPLGIPDALTMNNSLNLFPVVTTREALSDLPPILEADPTCYDYANKPTNPYQEFVRGKITPEEYYQVLSKGKRW